MRELVVLECSVCRTRGYTTTRNKKRQKAKITLRKYCARCRKHTAHKE